MLARRAMLAVVLAFAATAAAQAPAPRPAGEKGPTTIDAERIEGVSDLEVSAKGNAEIRRDDLTVFGEELRYNREFGTVTGEGGVRLRRGADRFSGPRLRYNTLDDTGVFEEPSYVIEGVRPARGGAERLEFLGKDRYRMTGARYTTCAPGRDDWYLEADQLELDYVAEEGAAKGPRLRFFDTTILAAPFAYFPLENSRKSGFLTPYYSQSTTRGAEVGIPYYWNIAPERDATLTPIYMSRRGVQLKSEFRYLDPRYSGTFNLEYMPEDRLLNRNRYGYSLLHTHTLYPNLTAYIDYNAVSDDRYFVDLSSQVRQVSVVNLQRDAYLSYSGSLGVVPYSAFARIQRFQTLQDLNAPVVSPYERVPQLNFNPYYNDLAGLFDTSAPMEYVRFQHPTLVEGSRTSMTPTVAMPRLAPGWFVTPKLGLRHASYRLQNTAPGQPQSPNVSIPWLSVDSGLIFDREARWFGESLTQTLEPRAFYVYVPYRDQSTLPLFDTGLADFNYAQLFTENRFAGGDRFGDANHLTLALTSRFLDTNGIEAFRATIAQRYHFDAERVGLTPNAPVQNFENSDILASVGGRLFRHWTFDATTQYNPRQERAERYTASVRYAPEIAKVLNLSYRFNRSTIRQVDVSGQWPVATGWYAVGRYNYSFLDRQLLEGIAGVEYNAGCWVFRGVVQRVRTAAQTSSTAFFLQLELNGIGQLGTEAVDLLKRNIPGYAVTNPRDPSLAPPSLAPRLPFEQVF